MTVTIIEFIMLLLSHAAAGIYSSTLKFSKRVVYGLIQYIFKVISKNNNVSPLKTVEIANSRIDLMRKMGIINKQSD